jgi:hypothetical protein
VAIGDVNGDGRPDLAVAKVSVLLFNLGGDFRSATDYDWLRCRLRSRLATNGDGIRPGGDVGTNGVTVLLNNGNGTFGAPTAWETGESTQSVVIADVNGDGRADLVAANFGSNTVSVLLGAGDGSFAQKSDFQTGACPFGLAVGDLDGDGRPDLAVANNCDGTVSVLLGSGGGRFGAKTDYETGPGAGSVAIADVNGDSVPDLAVANYRPRRYRCCAAPAGAFLDKGADAGNSPFPVVLGDVNGDGVADVVVANFWSSTASVLLGLGGTIAPSGVRLVAVVRARHTRSRRRRVTPLATCAWTACRTAARRRYAFTGVSAAHSISATFYHAAPRLVVEQPQSTALARASRDYGAVPVGGSSSLTFTIRNTGGRTSKT